MVIFWVILFEGTIVFSISLKWAFRRKSLVNPGLEAFNLTQTNKRKVDKKVKYFKGQT